MTDETEYTVDDIYGPPDGTDAVVLKVPKGYDPAPVWNTLTPECTALVLDAMAKVLTATLAAKPVSLNVQLALHESKEREHKAYEAGLRAGATATAPAIDVLKAQTEKLEEMNSVLANKLVAMMEAAFGKSGVAKTKGEIGESIVETWISERFPEASLTLIASTPHAMDLVVEFPGAPTFRVLIEVKNKDRLDKKDVDKFEADATANVSEAHAAVLLSLRTKLIPMRGAFQIARLGKMTVVYLADELALGGRGLALVLNMLLGARALPAGAADAMQEALTTALHTQRDIHARLVKVQKLSHALSQEIGACVLPSKGLTAALESAPGQIQAARGRTEKKK
ncbi:MAG: hypothetical protein KGL39_13115 [Patescibacteria group bacterium]|nr:hypothetical protein [Patescibacteria group bacterium]